MQFFCFLLIVLVAEIATGVYAYLNQDQLMKIVGSNVKNSIQNEYGSTELPTTVFDTFQKQVNSYGSSWTNSWKIYSILVGFFLFYYKWIA